MVKFAIITSNKQMNAASRSNFQLVVAAFCRQVAGVAVEDVDVLRKDVDVLEEVVPHEVVVTLRMVAGQTHILVHVERFHVLERNAPLAVKFNQLLVHPQRRTAYQQHKFKLDNGVKR